MLESGVNAKYKQNVALIKDPPKQGHFVIPERQWSAKGRA
jgi:hypothetical protein